MAKPKWRFASGNGGGAIDVVVNAKGKAFGWLCDAGSDDGSENGPRRYEWWIDYGAKGESTDYYEARRQLGEAAEKASDGG